MKTMFAYPARYEAGDDPSVLVCTFLDVPEAITEGRGLAEARTMAAEALGLALLTYVRMGRPLPRASARGNAEMVAVEPEVAAKLALIQAFADSGLTQRALGRRLAKDEKEVRRLLDPTHPSKLGPLSAALRELGRRLVISVETLPGEAA